MNWDRSDRIYAGGLAGLLAIAVALRLPGLERGLWLDEGYTWWYTTLPSMSDVVAQLRDASGGERLQPFYNVLLYAWTRMFGDSEMALRLPSLAFNLGSILVVAATARRLFGGRAGLVAALIGAASAYWVHYGTEIRPYALQMFLTTVILYAWAADAVSDVPRLGPVCWGILGAMLLAACTIFSFIPLVAIAVSDRRWFANPVRWIRFWGLVGTFSGAVFLFLYGSWLVSGGGGVGVPSRQGLIVSVVFAIYGIAVDQSYGPPVELLHGPAARDLVIRYWQKLFALGMLFLWLVVQYAAVFRTRATKAKPDSTSFVVSLIIMILLALLLGAGAGYAGNLNWLPRHAFYLAPILVLLLAAPFEGQPLLSRSAAPLLALLALNGLSIFNMHFDRGYAMDDYKGVARYLESSIAKNDTPVLLWGQVELLRDYYGVTNIVDGRKFPVETLEASLAAVARQSRGVIVVIDRPFYWAGHDFLAAYHGRCLKADEGRKFPYFELYRLSPVGDCTAMEGSRKG